MITRRLPHVETGTTSPLCRRSGPEWRLPYRVLRQLASALAGGKVNKYAVWSGHYLTRADAAGADQ
jgi:hypothetical protein